MFTFCLKRKLCVNFLNIQSIFLVQISFSPMLVENCCNLIVGKMFLITKKVFGELSLNLLCYMYVFILYQGSN